MLLLEHFCSILFLRYTGMDKTCSVCGAQTLIVDESSGKGLCVCVCDVLILIA